MIFHLGNFKRTKLDNVFQYIDGDEIKYFDFNQLTELEINSIIAHMNGYDKSDLFNSSNIYNKDDKTVWLHVADFIATYKDRKVI